MAKDKPAAEPVAIGFDSTQVFDGWLAQQRDLLAAATAAWAQQQQVATQAWFSWLDMLSAPAQSWPAGTWPGVPEDLLLAGPRLLQAWWAPWAPLLERGGEQLG